MFRGTFLGMREKRKQLKKLFLTCTLEKNKKKHFFLILLSHESIETLT